MGKSLGNCIYLKDSTGEVEKKVARMYTDPKRIRADIPGTVEGNPVFMYHDAFNPEKAEVEELKSRYRKGKVGDIEVKTKLSQALNRMLEPVREKRAYWENRRKQVREMLYEHTLQARKTTRTVLARVRSGMKLQSLGKMI
jgi:tryptophanyl-tRNA synthetase